MYAVKRLLWSLSFLILSPGLKADPTGPLLAQWSAKAAYHPPAAAKPEITNGNLRSTWTFSAPPRGTQAEEEALYQPVVEYLSRVTGKEVVYKHASNWLVYSRDMALGQYDLVFDGPHFNGWRQARLQHTPILKLPDDFVFVVVSRKDDAKINDMKQLAGRTVCAHAPPNLGTLTLLSRFDNPSRQPQIVETQGWKGAYDGLMEGKCVATVLPIKNLNKFDSAGRTQILYRHRALPNQAISAGPQIPADVQKKIATALVSAEGQAIARKLLDVYAAKAFVPAQAEEYAGLGDLLKDTLYYQ